MPLFHFTFNFNDETHTNYFVNENSVKDSPFDGLFFTLSNGSWKAITIADLNTGQNTIRLSDYFSSNSLATSSDVTIELHQYDNFSEPNDGLSWDNIKLTGITYQKILPEPPQQLSENAATFSFPVTPIN